VGVEAEGSRFIFRGSGGGRIGESSWTFLSFGVLVSIGLEGWAFKQLVVPWVNQIL